MKVTDPGCYGCVAACDLINQGGPIVAYAHPQCPAHGLDEEDTVYHNWDIPAPTPTDADQPPELELVTVRRPQRHIAICMECPKENRVWRFFTAEAVYAFTSLHRYACDGHNPSVF